MSLTSAQKAALVILGLDESVAVEILRNLAPDDLRRLSEVLEDDSSLPSDQLRPTLEEFERALSEPFVRGGGRDYVRKLAETALGPYEAQQVFDSEVERGPLDAIREARANSLAELMAEEHPQVAAIVLSQLSTNQASEVLMALSEERRIAILQRVTKIEELPRKSVRVASESFAEALAAAGAVGGEELGEFDGLSFAASLVNELGADDSERLLEVLEESDPDLVPRIREAMFTFEDLIRIDNRAMQTLMREVSSEQMLIALKTASESLREAVFGAVSSRAADSMREDLELMPPRKLSDVEQAQKEIVEIAMQLASDGRITLPTGGNEELV